MSGGNIRLDRRRFLGVAASAPLFSVPAFAAEEGPRTLSGRTLPFDGGWRFRKGEGTGFEAPGLDDSAWRMVDLPHDWSIEDLPVLAIPNPSIIGPFNRKAVGGVATGFTVGGEGWYRKTFTAPSAAGQRTEILFDGIYANSDVWLNGHHLGHHANGYTAVSYDLTPHLVPGAANVLAVRVRNLGENSRWYSGSGIYRHVWLDQAPAVSRLARSGIAVTTRRLSDGRATVAIETALENVQSGTRLVSQIKDPSGRTVWRQSVRAQSAMSATATVRNARTWSPDAPNLYTLETTVSRGGRIVDRAETPFGIRIVAFDVANGMTLNGTAVKLRGGCIHHDNGLIGAMAFDAAEERKVALMKARGYNAVRPSHNPFSPAFLAACDRLGLFVIAEAFDMWRWPKTPDDYSNDFAANWQRDLSRMILDSRNHPSIVMWSIGNEIPFRNTPEGVKLQWELANETHRLDSSRPVTAAINDFPGRQVVPSQQTARAGRGGKPDQASMVFLDVAGYNYKVAQYESDHAAFPERIIYGSESFSRDLFRTWEIADRSPWLIGDFVWTAIDYLGEAGLGGSTYVAPKYASSPGAPAGWPWVVAACGETDLIGYPKGASLARDVVWGISPLEIAVQKPPPVNKVEVPRIWGWRDERPSWTWTGAEGQPLSVHVYTRGDRVELRLNGAVVADRGEAAEDGSYVAFTVPYAPGTLEAVAYSQDREIGRRTLESAGPPAAIRLLPDKRAIPADRGAIAYLPMEIVDAAGLRVGDSQLPVQLTIDGAAELLGFGSANPLAVGSFQQPQAMTWDGRAMAILRSTGAPGAIRISASGEGLRGDVAMLRAG